MHVYTNIQSLEQDSAMMNHFIPGQGGAECSSSRFRHQTRTTNSNDDNWKEKKSENKKEKNRLKEREREGNQVLRKEKKERNLRCA